MPRSNDRGLGVTAGRGYQSVGEGEVSANSAELRMVMFRCVSWVAMLLAGLILWVAPALAQQGTPPVQRSYINPFPNGDRYRVVVLGDSLGDGLWSGLYRAFEDDATSGVRSERPR